MRNHSFLPDICDRLRSMGKAYFATEKESDCLNYGHAEIQKQ